MLPEALAQAIQEQFTHERNNEALYAAFSHILENVTWDGFAHWFRKSADDEKVHAEKIAQYLISEGLCPHYEALEPVPATMQLNQIFPIDLFRAGSERELQTTAKIRMLHHLADQQEHPESHAFFHWFLLEQVEEERKFKDTMQELVRAQDNASLVALDEKYGR